MQSFGEMNWGWKQILLVRQYKNYQNNGIRAREAKCHFKISIEQQRIPGF